MTVTTTAIDPYRDEPFIQLRDYAIWKENGQYVAYHRKGATEVWFTDSDYRNDENNIVGTANNVNYLTKTLIPYVVARQDEKDRHR